MAALILPGCGVLDLIDPVLCPGVISRAVEVEVRDARTGDPAADGATGTARSGNFVETLQVVGWISHPGPRTAVVLGGVDERPGVYTVTVEKPGYKPWERTGVVAERGQCGVRTASLTANLEHAPEI
ncbi:MAG: carboxypeptidase regulatory-like domain-containing protein [Gemmatimonadetes bacterium]|nr:carboxypeptidase regulatory-like domain-containing protein [Gemmatimonadota bacterium]